MPDFYGTADGFRAYHVARGNDVPADATDDDTVAEWLLLASEYIDVRILDRVSHTLKTDGRDQVREWPRVGFQDRYEYAIPNDQVPREIVNATYEAALIHANSNGALSVNYTPSKFKQVSVDGAVNVTYANFGSSYDAQTKYPKIEEILSQLFGGASSGISGFAARV